MSETEARHQVIPDAAVEAAHDQQCPDPYHLGPICDEYRTVARAALEAAAPHMLATSMKAVGIDPKETIEVYVSEDGIYATVRALDGNGERIVDPKLGAMNHGIYIPAQDS